MKHASLSATLVPSAFSWPVRDVRAAGQHCHVAVAAVLTMFLTGCTTLLASKTTPNVAATEVVPALASAVEALKRDIASDPQNPMLHYALASRALAVGDRALSLAQLRETLRLGSGFLPPRDLGLRALNDDPAYEAIRSEMESVLPRVNEDALRAFTLTDKTFLPEGIAYDASSRRFFIGSTVQKKIFAVDANGNTSTFVQDDTLDSLLGLAVERKTNRLLVISTNGFIEKDLTKRRNLIVAYDLAQAKEVERVRIADALQLNDIALLPDGSWAVSDTQAHRVWFIAGSTGSRSIRALTPAGATRGANGIAVSNDGDYVYVGAVRALLRVRVLDGLVETVRMPARESLAAIDGLVFHQGSLLAIQNSTNPGRVVRATLASDGLSVTNVETILSHHHVDVAEPTTLAVVEDDAYVLATTNVTAIDERGGVDKNAKLLPPVVLKVPLRR